MHSTSLNVLRVHETQYPGGEYELHFDVLFFGQIFVFVVALFNVRKVVQTHEGLLHR